MTIRPAPPSPVASTVGTASVFLFMDMIDEGPTASPKEETIVYENQPNHQPPQTPRSERSRWFHPSTPTRSSSYPQENSKPWRSCDANRVELISSDSNHAAQGKEPRFLQANNCGIQLAPLSQTSGITSLPADPGSLTRASQQGKRCEVFRGLKSGTWPAPNGPASRMPHGEGETRHLPSLPLQSSPPLTRTPQRLIFDPKATKSRLLVPIEKPLRLAATRKEMTNIYPSPESAFTPPPRTQRTIRFNDETLTGCDSENQQAVGAKEVAASKELGTPRNPAFQRDSFPKSEQSVIQTKGDDDRVAASLQVCAVSDDPASSGLTRQSILPAVHSLRSSPSNDLTATLFALLVHSDDSAMTRSLLILVISMDFLYKWSQVVSAFLTVVVGTNGGLATRLRYEKEPYAYSSQSLALSTSQRKVL